LLVVAVWPSMDCEAKSRETWGAKLPGTGGAVIGYDQLKAPEALDTLHCDDGLSDVAPKSPWSPELPAVAARIVADEASLVLPQGRYNFMASQPRDGLRPLRDPDAPDLDDDEGADG
jgi:hypothetical protein